MNLPVTVYAFTAATAACIAGVMMGLDKAFSGLAGLELAIAVGMIALAGLE